jgi:aerobic-type carbon monoxide dehydrogenase small subunit (CoxS/CutS family)
MCGGGSWGRGTVTHRIALSVNGARVETDVEGRTTLAELLRERLGLTGTHLGCEHGVCGACTVIVDKRPVRSCLMLAVQADGSSVETVESLSNGDELGLIQQAMWERHAFQCAFCAPGFLMTIRCLLDGNSEPSPEQIKQELSGNLCRCTGYASILDGVAEAVSKMRGGAEAVSKMRGGADAVTKMRGGSDPGTETGGGADA